MEINVKCFASLAEADKCDYSKSTPKKLPEGARVRDLLKEINIDEKDVKLIFVNSKHADFETVLHPGDMVGLAPPTGGM